MIPKVTAIVPHHLNANDQYLKWCLYSISKSEGVDVEIICISDAEECPDIQGDVLCVHDRALSNVTKKWHHGLKLARKNSKYIMIISDDVMVSKHTIAGLCDVIREEKAIIGPMSNCDSTTRYLTQIFITGKMGQQIAIPLKCTLDTIAREEECVIDIPRSQTVLLPQQWIGFYCTLFPRTVLEAVGDFDEKLDVRHNDVDYCMRASRLGIPSLIHLGVFALHFGDRTLPYCTSPQEYAQADEAMKQKYEISTPEEHGDLL